MKKNILFRLFYYFRVGYGTYLSLPTGLFSFATIVYTLFIERVSYLKALLPHFYTFLFWGVLFILIGGIFSGWLHFKRTHAYRSETEIAVESNPFIGKLQPGRETIFQPYNILYAKMIQRLADRWGLFENEVEREMWHEYVNMLSFLAKGKDLRDYRKAQT